MKTRDELFLHFLKDMYYAERAILKSLPDLIIVWTCMGSIIAFPKKRVMEALPRVPEPAEIKAEQPGATAWRARARR